MRTTKRDRVSTPDGDYSDLIYIIAINKTHFKFHCVVGKGGFGRVWKVERKKFRSMYAMKEMSKVRIVNKKSVNSVINERKLLSQLKHP